MSSTNNNNKNVSKLESKRLADIHYIMNQILTVVEKNTRIDIFVQPKTSNENNFPTYIALIYQLKDYTLISGTEIDSLREALSKIGITLSGIAAGDMAEYPHIKAKSVLEFFLMDTIDANKLDAETDSSSEEEEKDEL